MGAYDGIWAAHINGARIISMSFRALVPSGKSGGALIDAFSYSTDEFEQDTIELHDFGRLLFAAAGNDSVNIDAKEDGEETTWVRPCENQGVICVGGWLTTGKGAGLFPDPSSNFSMGGPDIGETIDIWGPYTVNVGDDPANKGNATTMAADMVRGFSGTSAATPFVAGVAALIWTANPALTNDDVWKLMDKWAIKTTAIRRVHAYRAVREALMMTGNTAPSVQIVSTQTGATLAPKMTTLEAVAYDVEEENGCCQQVHWTINGKDAGSGLKITHDFGADQIGFKSIEVTVTDSGGKTASATAVVKLVNAPPVIKITQAPAQLSAKTPGVFTAQIFDDSSVLSGLPIPSACKDLTWTSSVDPGVLATGCGPLMITFATPGKRTITASYTDAQKETGTATVDVQVGASSSALKSVIVTPSNGRMFGDSDEIPLQWSHNGGSGEFAANWTLTNTATGETKPFSPHPVTQTFRIIDVFPNIADDRTNLTLTLTVGEVFGNLGTPDSVTIVKREVIH